MIVIGKGSVQSGECDVMGHMNVRHYLARAGDGLAWLGLALGITPDRGFFTPVDQHIRFLREMAAGTPFTIFGGVVARRGDQLRAYVEIRNSGTGVPSAALVSDIELRDPHSGAVLPLPAGLEGKLAGLTVALPAHAGPRGLPFDPIRPLPDAGAAAAMGLTDAYIGAIRAEDCDRAGLMRPDVVISRIWDGVPNLRFPGAELGAREEGLGSAALEYRLAYLKPMRIGDLLIIRSGLRALGEKTTTWTHVLHDGVSGAPVAAAEAVGVSFDLMARKAVAIPPDRRRLLEGLLVPGLGL
ncbi:MAG: acyl-ACP thioesterase [Alphaproteobacteria bacterium]|nr:acyl-ACP thioesterase [Alphaproteobacteria bacterium]